MQENPIARCPANEVEAWFFPFYVTLAKGSEPAFLYLEDHVYNFDDLERELVAPKLIEIKSDEDLKRLEFAKDGTGTYLII